jgi:amino-acid N-acetyltransferase
MNIRKATMRDIPGLLRLINGYARDGIMLPRNEFELSEGIRDFTVADSGERLLGCAALHFYGPSIAEVRSLAVAPDAKGQGTGRLLMDALDREAREFGLDAVFAFTYVPGFFSKLGYVEVDRGDLPLKAWKDCLRCPKFQACDEFAVLKILKEGATLPSGKAAALDEPFGQLPILRHN